MSGSTPPPQISTPSSPFVAMPQASLSPFPSLSPFSAIKPAATFLTPSVAPVTTIVQVKLENPAPVSLGEAVNVNMNNSFTPTMPNVKPILPLGAVNATTATSLSDSSVAESAGLDEDVSAATTSTSCSTTATTCTTTTCTSEASRKGKRPPAVPTDSITFEDSDLSEENDEGEEVDEDVRIYSDEDTAVDPHSKFPFPKEKAHLKEAATAPSDIPFQTLVLDIAFHPSTNLIASALVSGSIKIHRYAMEEKNTLVLSKQTHKDSCRTISFAEDGKYLISGSADCSLRVTDVSAGKTVFSIKGAHKHGVNTILVEESMLASGDDVGRIKIWDIRQKSNTCSWKKHHDYISTFLYHSQSQVLLSAGADGCLGAWDLRKGKVQGFSDNFSDDILSLSFGLNKGRVLCGTQSGKVIQFKWGQWGAPAQIGGGHPQAVEDIIEVSENMIFTGSSDGVVRVVQVEPFKLLGIVGTNGAFPAERLSVSWDQRFLACAGQLSPVKFWDVNDFFHDVQDDDDDEDNESDEEEEAEGDEEAEEEDEEEDKAEGEDVGEEQDGEEEAENKEGEEDAEGEDKEVSDHDEFFDKEEDEDAPLPKYKGLPDYRKLRRRRFYDGL
ncbi:transducin family protein wd-40 repeat family protein [Pelomyxa schiedti]|nr:transducin family protein wd-40 repeat family protein [Pelomyxa schiedti]